MKLKEFEKIWKEFKNSKFDRGLTRRKTAWNILEFIERKSKK